MSYNLWQLPLRNAPKLKRRHEFARITTILFRVLRSSNASSVLTQRIWNLLYSNSLRSLGWSYSRQNLYTSASVIRSDSTLVNPSQPDNVASVPHIRWDHKLWRMFCSTWGVLRSKSNVHYLTHRDFKLFFLSASPRKSFQDLISASKYLAKWMDSYNLLFSLFRAEARTLLLANKLFLEESLVFNWGSGISSYKLFKYSQPFITYTDLSHGSFTQSVLNQVTAQELDLLLIADVKTRSKFMFHAQRNNIPSLGLIPVSYSPWSVSYPVPVFSDSKLVQLYFLRWLLSIKSYATASNYGSMCQVWQRRVL